MDEKTLYVDLGILKSKLSSLTKLERSLGDIESTLNTLTGGAGSFWDGSAYEVFVENQEKLSNDVKTLKTQVEDSRERLDKAIGAYEQVEEDISGVVENLSTADIF